MAKQKVLLYHHPEITSLKPDDATTFHGWELKRAKVSCALREGGRHGILPVNYSNASHSWESVSSCVRWWADTAVLQLCYTAPRASSSNRYSWLPQRKYTITFALTGWVVGIAMTKLGRNSGGWIFRMHLHLKLM